MTNKFKIGDDVFIIGLRSGKSLRIIDSGCKIFPLCVPTGEGKLLNFDENGYFGDIGYNVVAPTVIHATIQSRDTLNSLTNSKYELCPSSSAIAKSTIECSSGHKFLCVVSNQDDNPQLEGGYEIASIVSVNQHGLFVSTCNQLFCFARILDPSDIYTNFINSTHHK